MRYDHSKVQTDILTLSVQQKNVRIVAEDQGGNDNAPSHRIFAGRTEIGAAWAKKSRELREYLSVKLDDPSPSYSPGGCDELTDVA